MFRHKAQLHRLEAGERHAGRSARAAPSFYEARGEFQLNVEEMRRAGLGALYEAFEKLKAQAARPKACSTPERKQRAAARFRAPSAS